MAHRPYHPPPPFQAPVSGDIDQRLAAIATELNRKQDAGVANTAFPFIGMLDDTGQTWRLTVDAAGVLHTELVPRS